MNNKLLLLLIAFVMGLHVKGMAQDPHFSQYFSSHLMVNPALTGFFDGDYRVAINERQQWWNVGDNYNTTSISTDVKILKENIPEFDTFGIGISGIFDKSLSGALLSNYLSLSGAYHKSLANAGRQTLAVAFQATFANRHVDYGKLSFASQFNGIFFDPARAVNIDYSNSNTNYFDVNTGILYTLHSENSGFYIGAALYHTNKPNESLFNSTYNVPIRETLHGGGEIAIDPQSSVLFSGVYMLQKSITDQLLGVAYGLKINEMYNNSTFTKLYIGFWYRRKDSYIPYLGLDYNNISVGVNYSIPVSPIYTLQPHTVEVSLIYRHKFTNQSPICPRF